MSDTTKVRVGLQGARELEIEVEDVDAVKSMLEAAAASDEDVLWITDARGHQFGLITDKLAFVEIESETGTAGIGF